MFRYRITLAQDARVYTETLIEADDDAAAIAQGAAAVRAGDLDPDWDGMYQGRGLDLLLGFGDPKSLAFIVDRLGDAPGEITEVYEGDLPPETPALQDGGPSCVAVPGSDGMVAPSAGFEARGRTLAAFATAVQDVVRALPDSERGGFVLDLARSIGWHPLCVLDKASVLLISVQN